MYNRSRNKWTESEIEIIKENYHSGIEFVRKLLKLHTIYSIKKKAKELSLVVEFYNISELKDIVSKSNSIADVCRYNNIKF